MKMGIIDFLISNYEKTILKGLIYNYPHWNMEEQIENIGIKLSRYIEKPRITTKYLYHDTSLFERLVMAVICEKYESYHNVRQRINAMAKLYYVDCFFSTLDNARLFVTAVCFPKYLWDLVKSSVEKVNIELFLNRKKSDIEIIYLATFVDSQ